MPRGTWSAARKKAQSDRLKAVHARKRAGIRTTRTPVGRYITKTWAENEAPMNGAPNLTEAIRTRVRAILPEIIDEELAALLK